MSDRLPYAVAALALGVDITTIHEWAAQGRLGSTILAPGCRKKRLASRREIEARLGPIDDERLADAWARYQRGEHVPATSRKRRDMEAVS